MAKPNPTHHKKKKTRRGCLNRGKALKQKIAGIGARRSETHKKPANVTRKKKSMGVRPTAVTQRKVSNQPVSLKNEQRIFEKVGLGGGFGEFSEKSDRRQDVKKQVPFHARPEDKATGNSQGHAPPKKAQTKTETKNRIFDK